MDAEMLARAQYNQAEHRSDFTKSSRFSSDIHLDFDPDGNPCYEVTIVRGNELLDHQYAHSSHEQAEGIVSRWSVQLNLEHTSTEMWGQS